MGKCKYIYIHKSDDTNWNEEQLLEVTLTAGSSAVDLSTMTAEFILGSYKLSDIPLGSGSFRVDLGAAVTGSFPYGPINGTIKLYDSEGRVKTVANQVPFFVTSEVITSQNQNLVFELPQVSIDVTVGGSVSYNNLTDKPTINGVIVQGDKLATDYGLATEAGLSQKVSKSGDTMTGDLVMSEGTQITMADGAITSNAGMLGLEGEEYGLLVDVASGNGAVLKIEDGVGNILTNLDVKSTFNDADTDPVNGIAVAQAISGKQDTITGAGTSITQNNLTADRAVISDNNGKVAVSNVTATELGYVSGLTGAIQTQINNEVNARTAADNNLQSQIDAITSASDVFDVVGTYAQLQAYDKAEVPLNDIIKVLQDETHDNAATYYRLVEVNGVKDWRYIGEEGPYYTKSEADSEFLSQADAATTYLTQANAASTYATQTSLSRGLATKASNADETTIFDNGATISTVAVKEQNANVAVKEWVGTKAQYEAIATKDANTTYIVTDEDDSAFLSVDSTLSSTSENPVQNRVIATALAGKQATLPAGTTGYFLQKTATGVAWAAVQAGGGAPTLTWYTGNTGTTVTIDDTSSAALVKIYKNGILLEPTADYSISGTTLTLVTALVSTDKITVEVF